MPKVYQISGSVQVNNIGINGPCKGRVQYSILNFYDGIEEKLNKIKEQI